MIVEIRDKRGGRALAAFDDDELHVGGRMFVSKDGYVYRRKRIDGRVSEFNVARLILGLAKDDPRQADHINRDRLDNRRANLRIVTRQQQAQNRSKHRIHAQSQHGLWCAERGVHWHARAGKWVAKVRVNGQSKHLGYYDSVEAASVVAKRARKATMPFAVG